VTWSKFRAEDLQIGVTVQNLCTLCVCVCVCVCFIVPEIEDFENLRYAEIRCNLRISSLLSFPCSFSSYDIFSLLHVISIQGRSSMASAPRDSQLLGAVGASETNLRVWVTMRPCCELFLGALAKLRKATSSVVMSVSPHRKTRLLLDGFSWNLIFDYFF